MQKTALITGITGQDGSSYLSRLLLGKGFKVVGITRSYTLHWRYEKDFKQVLDLLIEEELTNR